MALDGIATAYIVHELKKALLGGRIDKAHQPEADEIILTIKSGGSRKLLISASAQGARAHLTNLPKDNPMTAPLFCMVLRKRLLGGRIVDISQQEGFERVINFDIEAMNEMGDMAMNRLSVEIMGKHSNIILIGEDGVIIDAIKHINHEKSSLREVLPGRAHTLPPGQDKANPASFLDDFTGFYERAAKTGKTARKSLSDGFMGVSPATASEMAHRAGIGEADDSGAMTETQARALFEAFGGIVRDALSGTFKGELALDENGNPVDFAPFEMTAYSRGRQAGQSMSSLMDDFYGERDQLLRISQKSADLRRLVSLNIERCVKKHDMHERTLAEIENRDVHRLYGELLTANLYRLSQGMEKAVLENYNDPEGKRVEIPLDARLTPTQNAQRWYKLYNKEKRRFDALKDQIKQNASELAYLESVMTALQNAAGEADLNEVREELAEEGFAKRRNPNKSGKAVKNRKGTPLTYTSSDGFLILVGKNNRQNDELTGKTAEPFDLWLHSTDIPGSHVIIKTEGKTVPDGTVEEAASLAAYYSKARTGSLVPVDYTLRKYVKKPGGAKPGMVTYTHQRTAFVKPSPPAEAPKGAE